LLAQAGKFSMKNTYKIVASLAGVALLIAMVVIPLWAFSQIKEAAEARKHTYLIINRAENLLSELRDAETGQRGYSLTGDEAFLEPYLAVRNSISGHLEELRQLTLSSAAHKHLDAMAPLIAVKLAEMQHVIELRRNHDMTVVLAVVGSGKGKQLMDSIRAEKNSFIQLEEGVLSRYEAEFQSNMRHLFIVIVTISLLMLLFAILFSYLIYREIQHRLKNLVHLETQHLLEIQEDTNKQLQQANVNLQVSAEKIQQMAYHDTLTGLPNRKLFSDRLGIALAQAQRNQIKAGITMLDLDHFKGVNDTLGHDVGDLLLKAAAERLRAALRKGDTVARFGGDEFVLILPDLEVIEDAIQVVQKIVDSFRKPFLIDTHQLVVTTSIGIAIYPNDGTDEGILLKNADIAMYQAKQTGRDRYQLCKKS
jgi:diguanylate cyclase (GGDEF)-like protein